ncbi:PD40 domain-containing protein [Streptomyces sp. CBMA156]|uniref:PD40 domain-containing protein n=1 Tax=Streptomyces sp. CBMA156 TaxID=1930280 RepID=UPI001661DCF0|nr:PD40 domain-containing protein [Streptomyces sp. CBMA156]MBD0672663.1 hypothetical protein [Streptomyces sp. CBMA156]
MTTAPTRRRLARAAAVLLATAVAGAVTPAAEAKPPKGDTARVSTTAKGAQLTGTSSALGLSDDGRSALFASNAPDLLPVAGVPNTSDVYVRDLRNGHVERVSVADDGSRLDAPTTDASISGDGRYVAFSTAATNVVPGQVPHPSDVYVHDRRTGSTELISAAAVPNTDDQSYRVSENPSISQDGRYVAFSSNRTDFLPESDLQRQWRNIYVFDRWTETSRLITVGADGSRARHSSFRPTISADGSAVVFKSRARNLVPSPGTDTPAPAPEPGPDVDSEAPDTEAPGTDPLLPRLPRYDAAYAWTADTGRIVAASVTDTGRFDGTWDTRISPDGRYALYSIPAREVPVPPRLPHPLHVFAHDLATGKVTRIDTRLPGTTERNSSSGPAMTGDGRWVYFHSEADNLVPGDTNGVRDVFRRDLWTGRIERVSLTLDGEQNDSRAEYPFPDESGDTVIFSADDGNLVPGDTNATTDVFLRRL